MAEKQQRCTGKTASGKRCKRGALEGSNRCKIHPPKKGGRPPLEWDEEQWHRFDIFCSTQKATQDDIACAMQADVKTIDGLCKRVKELGFSDYLKKKRANSCAVLEGKQFEVAMTDGHKSQGTMLIWLGKQWLDQREPPKELNHSGPRGGPVKVQIIKIGDQEIEF